MKEGIFDEENRGFWAMILFGVMVLSAFTAFIAWLPSQATAQEMPAYARAICEAECPTREKEIHLMIPDNADSEGVVIEISEKKFRLIVHEDEGTMAWVTELAFPINLQGMSDKGAEICILKKTENKRCLIMGGQIHKVVFYDKVLNLLRMAVEPKKWKATATPAGVDLWLSWTKVETFVQPKKGPGLNELGTQIEIVDRYKRGGVSTKSPRCNCEKWGIFLSQKKFYRQWGDIDKLPMRFVGSTNFQVPEKKLDPDQPW